MNRKLLPLALAIALASTALAQDAVIKVSIIDAGSVLAAGATTWSPVIPNLGAIKRTVAWDLTSAGAVSLNLIPQQSQKTGGPFSTWYTMFAFGTPVATNLTVVTTNGGTDLPLLSSYFLRFKVTNTSASPVTATYLELLGR